MAYSMEISEGGKDFQSSKTRKTVFCLAVLMFIVGFTAGILIGHFAIGTGGSSDCIYVTGDTAGQEQNPGTDPGDEEPVDVSEWILTQLNASNIETYLRNLSSKPHVAGTEMDWEQAEQLRQFWLDVGLDSAVLTPYNVTLSYPDKDKDNWFKLYDITEDEVLVKSPPNPKYFESNEDILPPFTAYSPSGSHSNKKIVYANYGRKTDFDHLEMQGVSLNDTIVLIRYGKGGRGSKMRNAHDRGAVGVLLYSDPFDYIRSDISLDNVYPKSEWMSANATQRGSPFGGIGDPLTPGFPSIESAYYVEEDKILGYWPNIMTVPVGYGVAQQIFEVMDGEEVSHDEWKGRLNVTYRYTFTNTSTILANLTINNNVTERKLSYNAFGLIRGAVEPDRYVLLGNHRDSWIDGAIDPSSGTATMMELSRILGTLLKEGRWRPRRSILFCSWGSEEYGLIGSTEWIEENAKVLDQRAVAYINLDIAVTGKYTLRGLGSPPIYSAMYNATKKVSNPNTTDQTSRPTVYDDWVIKRPWKDPNTMKYRNVPIIPSPGGSSDHGSFQMRAGITCADFRYDEDFSGDLGFYSLYHTEEETFDAVRTYVDPGFTYHATVGKLSGELLRNLADSLIIPFNMSDYTTLLEDYSFNLLNNSMETLNNLSINTKFLHDAIDMYQENAQAFHSMVGNINTSDALQVRAVNDQMMLLDRAFLVPEGIPERPQYKHVVHSTDWQGYAAPSFAGVTDSLVLLGEQPNNSELEQTIKLSFSVVVFTIQSAANSLKNSTDFLRHQMM